MKYVACYIRVSTEEQVKFGFSIEAQKDSLEKYCKDNKYKYEFYIDEGISASSMKKRKALNEMLNKSNVFDMVLFTKLDRLSRNVLDANNINKILKENNCTMKAIDEDDIDTSTADGTFMFNLKVSLAQREIGKTSERIRFVFNNKREKGEVTSGTKKYGYDIENRKFVVNKKESENIINLYNYFISCGGNYKETYKYFILHFPNGSQDTLYKYLRDTSYIGKYKLYRKDIYIDNYIPRIMDDDLFYTVQNLLKKKEKISKRTVQTSIFSGMIYCNQCKRLMCKKKDNRIKKRVIRYACDSSYRYKPNTLEKKCNNTTLIREEVIEEYLLNNVNNIAKSYITNNTVTNLKPQNNNVAEIAEIEKKINKLKDLYLEDLIDKTTYKEDYTQLNKRLTELKQQEINPKEKDLSNLKSFINTDIDKIYSKLTEDEKRVLWISVIDKIYIEDGKIKEVTFL